MNGQLANVAILGEKPLVTFALFAYNQEKYIREAVEGALTQTYSPLQIILSDDCSYDNTFEMMKKMVSEYSGPHEVLLNRNIHNMGLAGHINHVTSLAKGELVVVAAGDDISYPERTSTLYEFFTKMNYPAVVFSDLEEIDNDGSPWVGEQVGQSEQTLSEFILRPSIRGATCAYDKRIFTQFLELNSDVTAEDRALPVRAYLLGRPPKIINRKLIKYRRDAQRVRGPSNAAMKFFWQIWPQYSSAKQNQKDVNYIDEIDIYSSRVIQLNFNYHQAKIDVIKTKSIVGLTKQSLHWLRMFGVKQLVKLLIIRYGKLGQRESALLIQNIPQVS